MARITRIERQKRSPKRVSIFVDDCFAFGLREDVACRFALSTGQELTDELRRSILAENAVLDAKTAADRLLGRRPYSAKEIRARLLRKGFAPEAVDAAVETFLRAGLIDDRAFALAFVKDRIAFRPKSRKMLEVELRNKGVCESIAGEVLDELLYDELEEATADRIASRYIEKHSSLPEDVLHRRVYAFLRRRGFDSEIILKALGDKSHTP